MATKYTRRINLYINGKEVKNDVASIRREMNKLTKEQARMTIGSKEYVSQAKKIHYLKGILNKHNQQLRQTKRSYFSLAKAADKFNKYSMMAMSFIAALSGVILGLRKAAEEANLFEEALDNLSALTGLEGKELEWLGDQAKKSSVKITEAGVRIKQSATDIVDAYMKMGSQRPELLKDKEALAEVTENAIILSEAAKMDLDPAVRGLAMAMNQHNLAATESGRVINVMAAGSKEGAGNIPYLTAAIEKSGTTFSLMNISLEEHIGLIETIAPNYSEASEAGNSLDKTFLHMKAQGIGVVDGMFDVNRALEELKTRFANGESAVDLFGLRHAKMAQLLSEKIPDFNKYTKAVTATNVATEQAVKNTDNNAAKLQQVRNELKLNAIELGERLNPVMLKSLSLTNRFVRLLARWAGASPVKELQKEQEEVNGLYLKLNSANLAEQERLDILGQLKVMAPDLHQTIVDETSNIKDLTEALKDYNSEMALKLLIAEGNEDIAAQKAKVSSLQRLSAKSEMEMAKQMKSSLGWFGKNAPQVKDKANSILFDTQKTLLQKAEELNRLALDNTSLGSKSLFFALDSYRLSRQRLADENNSLDLLISQTKATQDEWKHVFGDVPEDQISNAPAKIEEEVKALKSLITIQEELLASAQKLPESTEAQITAKNQWIQSIETEIARLQSLGVTKKEALDLSNLLATADDKQQEAFRKYFSDAGKGAFKNFQKAFDEARKLNSFSFAASIQTDEEEDPGNYDPSADYAVWKHQQSLEYQFALNGALHDKQLIGVMEYEDRKTELTRKAEEERYQIRIDKMDKVLAVAEFGANAVKAMMDMELEDAGNNEEKKKAIRKKYADMNFAVTSANIIAATALGIMRSFELGPVAGAIAAVLIGITGGAQLAMANKQRQKVKALAQGKYPVLTDDGNSYDTAFAGRPKTGMYNGPQLGVFNEVPGFPEIVIDGVTTRKLQVNHPGILDAIYDVRDGRVPGFAGGKYPSDPSSEIAGNSSSTAINAILKANNDALVETIRELQIFVSVEDIERKRENFLKIKNTSGL